MKPLNLTPFDTHEECVQFETKRTVEPGIIQSGWMVRSTEELLDTHPVMFSTENVQMKRGFLLYGICTKNTPFGFKTYGVVRDRDGLTVDFLV